MHAFDVVRAAAEAGDEEAQRRLRIAADRDPEVARYLNQPFRFDTRSPIEDLLAFALLEQAHSRLVPEVYQPQRDLFVSIPDAPSSWFRLETLVQIGRYEADILLTEVRAPDAIRLVVECDGHDFHERTKEQAEHDRRRDRELAAIGLHVLRFTGSELHRDASAAAREVFAFLAAELQRRGR